VSKAGQFLRFLLFEEEMLAEEAAERTGLTVAEIGGIIAGDIPMDAEIAEKLAKLRGTTKEMWLEM
jgi:plasmid maintenance system antidote protein VapI